MEEEKPSLERASFTFTQKGNCISNADEHESLTIKCESDLGIDYTK